MTGLMEVQDLAVRRAGRLVLDGVSHVFQPGITALLGPNGAGKSTLLAAMDGVLLPERGRVTLEGRDLASMRRTDVAKRLACLAQDERPDDALGALETVLLGRAPHLGAWGLPSADDVTLALSCMDRTGTRAFENRPLHTLSGGERQRVMVARVLCQGGQVLLLDEPTDALDPGQALHVMQVLQEEVGRGATVCVVLHDLTLAARFAQHVVLLRQGRVVASGAASDTLTPDLLSQTYGAPMSVGMVDGKPVVVAS